LLRPEVGDEAGSWAAWAKWAVKPGGPGWCQFGLAGRPRPKEWAGRLGWKRKEKGNPLKIDF
jgi:hypothetical protein